VAGNVRLSDFYEFLTIARCLLPIAFCE
jgi:hypothetical protein